MFVTALILNAAGAIVNFAFLASGMGGWVNVVLLAASAAAGLYLLRGIGSDA